MTPPDSSNIPVGTVLEGKFRVTQEIGRGGMAAVYEAENIDIGKRVAVKILSAELITSRVVRERFIREARAAAAIHSPYICEVFDSGMFHDRPFLVMELLHGESLYDRMTRLRCLKVATTLKIIRHVARGLGKAHEAGVVHRDLKPENIVLTRDHDGRLVAKIVDFGLAKFYESRGNEPEQNVRLTREGALFGTPAYMSPEQAKGQGEVDHRADLWALACIVYECLTGRTVWDVQQGVAMILAQIAKGELPDPLQYRPDLPTSFRDWFYTALHPDPKRRYQTTRSFVEALEGSFSAELAPISVAESSVERPSGADSTRHLMGRSGSRPSDQEELLAPTSSAAASARPEVRDTSGQAIALLLGAATICLGAYGFFLYAKHPPQADPPAPAAVIQDAGAAENSPQLEPAERCPGADWIHRAQLALRKEDLQEALKALENARGEAPNVAGSLIAHIEAGQEPGGDCSLAGLGRPRPFELSDRASHPRIVAGKDGLLVAWTDSHEEPSRMNVYATLLDDALRRVGNVRNITPEATMAIQPRFAKIPEGFAMLYWDSAKVDSGVFIRSIEDNARITSPPHRLSEEKRGQYFPALTTLPDGALLAVWSDKETTGTHNLVAQRLHPDLSADGGMFYLTHLKTGSALEPFVDVYADQVYLSYRYLNRAGESSIQLMRLPGNLTEKTEKELRLARAAAQTNSGDAADADQASSATPGSSAARATSKSKTKKATEPPAEVAPGISLIQGEKHAAPALSCNQEGCMVVWDDEKSGSYAAYIPHQGERALWHKEFSKTGKRPNIRRSGHGDWAIAYYDEDRLKMVTARPDGLRKSSVITRVSGYHPAPDLLAEDKAGSWLLTWRDFEAGHREIFIARAQCLTESE